MVKLSYYEIRNIKEEPTADNVRTMNQEGA
jgi:hypothetical protein